MTRVSLSLLAVCASLGVSTSAYGPALAQTATASADPVAIELLDPAEMEFAAEPEQKPKKKSIFRRGLRALFGSPANNPYSPGTAERATSPELAPDLRGVVMTPDFDPGTVSDEEFAIAEPATGEADAEEVAVERPILEEQVAEESAVEEQAAPARPDPMDALAALYEARNSKPDLEAPEEPEAVLPEATIAEPPASELPRAESTEPRNVARLPRPRPFAEAATSDAEAIPEAVVGEAPAPVKPASPVTEPESSLSHALAMVPSAGVAAAIPDPARFFAGDSAPTGTVKVEVHAVAAPAVEALTPAQIARRETRFDHEFAPPPVVASAEDTPQASPEVVAHQLPPASMRSPYRLPGPAVAPREETAAHDSTHTVVTEAPLAPAPSAVPAPAEAVPQVAEAQPIPQQAPSALAANEQPVVTEAKAEAEPTHDTATHVEAPATHANDASPVAPPHEEPSASPATEHAVAEEAEPNHPAGMEHATVETSLALANEVQPSVEAQHPPAEEAHAAIEELAPAPAPQEHAAAEQEHEGSAEHAPVEQEHGSSDTGHQAVEQASEHAAAAPAPEHASDEAHASEEHASDEGPASEEHATEEHAAEGHASDESGHGSGDGLPPDFQPLPVPLAIDATPRLLVQELQNLQDRIAQGSTDAFAAQRGLLDNIDRGLLNVPAEAWQDRLNAAALVTYVLSGGKPNALRRLLDREPLPALEEPLLRGALAYVEGDFPKAKELLANFDARNFPASMGSQLAIAQAALAYTDNPKRAVAMLDVARLLSPGTLAEEAALRRELLVVSQLEDADKFEQLSRQYVQRFRHSVYAGNFRQRFASALTRMAFVDDPAEMPRLDRMLSDLELETRRELYLTVARAAVVRARIEAARFAAGRVLEDAESDNADRAQALLYRAAASVVLAEEFVAAREDLDAIDQMLLDPPDQKLMGVVAGIAEAIATASEPQPMPAEASVAQAEADTDESADESPAIMKAREAIRLADNLLGAQTR